MEIPVDISNVILTEMLKNEKRTGKFPELSYWNYQIFTISRRLHGSSIILRSLEEIEYFIENILEEFPPELDIHIKLPGSYSEGTISLPDMYEIYSDHGGTIYGMSVPKESYLNVNPKRIIADRENLFQFFSISKCYSLASSFCFFRYMKDEKFDVSVLEVELYLETSPKEKKLYKMIEEFIEYKNVRVYRPSHALNKMYVKNLPNGVSISSYIPDGAITVYLSDTLFLRHVYPNVEEVYLNISLEGLYRDGEYISSFKSLHSIILETVERFPNANIIYKGRIQFLEKLANLTKRKGIHSLVMDKCKESLATYISTIAKGMLSKEEDILVKIVNDNIISRT